MHTKYRRKEKKLSFMADMSAWVGGGFYPMSAKKFSLKIRKFRK